MFGAQRLSIAMRIAFAARSSAAPRTLLPSDSAHASAFSAPALTFARSPPLARRFFFSKPSASASSSSSFSSSTDSSSGSSASDSDLNKPLSFSEKLSAAWALASPRMQTIGLATGAGLFGLSILTGIVHILEYAASLSFANVGAFAYMAGLVTAALTAASYTYLRSYFIILRPDRILRKVLNREARNIKLLNAAMSILTPRVTGDATVQKIYGSDVSLGRFEAFAYAKHTPAQKATIGSIFASASSTVSSAASAAASSFSASAASKKAAEEAEAENNETYLHRSALARATDYWHSHKTLQVMFEIRGKLGKGYVAAELVLDGGKPKYNSLTVTHAKEMQRLLLEGDAAPPLKAVLSNSDLLTAVLRTEEEPLTVIQQRSVGGKKL